MILRLYDPTTLYLVDTLSLYESVQWITSYNTPDSEFQIDCSTEYSDILLDGRIVENSEDSEHIGIIRSIQTVKTMESNKLVVRGIMLERELLHRRVAKGIIAYRHMYPTTVIANLLGLSMKNPVESARVEPLLGDIIFANDEDIPDMEETSYSATYPNLEDEVFTLLQSIELGYKVKLNKKTSKLDVEFYLGTDHTEGAVDPVMLSRDWGTLTDLTYTKDSTQNITNVYCIGSDNIYVEVGKLLGDEKELPDVRVEKAVDCSSDVPWPTYPVEKPNESGGSYYQYKKVDSKEFVTNVDVWEKYDVERIENTYTMYEEIVTSSPTPISQQQLSQITSNKGQLFADAAVQAATGFVLGSSVDTKTAVDKALSQLKSTTLMNKSETIGYGFDLTGSFASKAANPISMGKPVNITYPSGYKKPPAQRQRISLMAAKTGSGSSSKNKVTAKLESTKSSSLNSAGKPGTFASAGSTVQQLGAVNTSDGVQAQVTNCELKPYEVTEVTYEVRDFVEYVYADKGTSPSSATKVISGSVESGTVMMYEHFEDVKAPESEYREALSKYGKKLLQAFTDSESVDVVLYQLSNMQYKRDYGLGDYVTVKDKSLGFELDLRVVKATEVWDSTGYNVTLTLGTNVPQLTERIKMISKGGM